VGSAAARRNWSGGSRTFAFRPAGRWTDMGWERTAPACAQGFGKDCHTPE